MMLSFLRNAAFYLDFLGVFDFELASDNTLDDAPRDAFDVDAISFSALLNLFERMELMINLLLRLTRKKVSPQTGKTFFGDQDQR